MALLFADSTYDINLGLLSDELKWLELKSHSGQRASAILQTETQKLCHSHGVSPRDLKAVITVAGPGFYTGLRLSEGFADIFKVFKVPCFSFYSYEIPRWCGYRSGVWMTKAYRGEYFFHDWSEGGETVNTLVAAKDLAAQLARYEHVFIHSPSAIDQNLMNYSTTLDLLRTHSEHIMGEVIKNQMHRESFYFRAPEDEFRVSV